MSQSWRFETAAVHAGHAGNAGHRSVAPPIYESAAFAFDSAQHAIDLFDGRAEGMVYSRIANPSVRMLEARVASLELGAGAIATASGQAALTCAFLTIAGAGDNIAAVPLMYGTTYNLLKHVLPQYGISANIAASSDFGVLEAMIDQNTRALFCETIANPAGRIADIETLAMIAHEHGIPLIVDNTVATPYLCRPFEHGADIVVHSLTKYMAGHGALLGGAVVDSGEFPWMKYAERYPRLTAPDDSHHGINFSEKYGRVAFSARCASVPLRTMGAVLSPAAAVQIMRGLETLALRMERTVFNAEVISRFLQQHPSVAWVRYPGQAGSIDESLALKYLGGKGGGIVSFGVRGDAHAPGRLLDSLKLIKHSVNLGDCKTLMCHPASTTHRQLAPADLLHSGVTDELLRISVGIEHIEDLLDDLDNALNSACPR